MAKRPAAGRSISLGNDLVDAGLREIEARGQWLRAAYAERLRDYPDPQYLAEETTRTESQVTAIVERLKSDYLLRQNVKR